MNTTVSDSTFKLHTIVNTSLTRVKTCARVIWCLFQYILSANQCSFFFFLQPYSLKIRHTQYSFIPLHGFSL
jgi:hypothetical protein